jgi:hypothetical protein
LLLLGCSSRALEGADGDTSAAGAPAEGAARVVNVSLTRIYQPSSKVALRATALAFNAAVEGELWVTLRQPPSGKPCTMTDDSGCSALVGVVAVIDDATSDEPHAVVKEDGNAWHFMRRPAAIAWGNDELFASCGEALTDNYEDDDTPYAGPVLWSSDPKIFGVEPGPGQNGTHIDMLHETPYCMGLAHEADNAFWAFNGNAGSLDRVDFHAPHAVGGDDHSDGEVHRYVTGQLLRVPEVPSHLAYDGTRGLVYVADTGHARVISVDPSQAKPSGPIMVYETLQGSGAMDGARVTELVSAGTLQKPSGLAFANETLYVTDNETGLIHELDPSGKTRRILDPHLAPGELGGIALGPDQRLYVTNLHDGSVSRVEAP